MVQRDNWSVYGQGWQRQVTREIAGHKVRATVYRDSYESQSRLYVEVWSPEQLSWNRIQTLSGVDFKDLPSAYNTPPEVARPATQPVIEGMFGYAEDLLS